MTIYFLARPYITIEVLRPTEGQVDGLIVEEGRLVDVRCTSESVFGSDTISWLKDGVPGKISKYQMRV